jgi:hypothetical protein
MEEKKKTFAFPIVNELGHLYHPGMELRDWFAGMALANSWCGSIEQDSINDVARVAYRIADAMMEARSK